MPSTRDAFWVLSVVKVTTINVRHLASSQQLQTRPYQCKLLIPCVPASTKPSNKPALGNCSNRSTTCRLLHKYCIYPSIAVHCTLDLFAKAIPCQTLSRHRPSFCSSRRLHCRRSLTASRLRQQLHSRHQVSWAIRSGAASRAAGTSGDQGLSRTFDRGAFSQIHHSRFSTNPKQVHPRQSSCQAAARHAQAPSIPNRQCCEPASHTRCIHPVPCHAPAQRNGANQRQPGYKRAVILDPLP
jgi:hypothetical protein